VLAPSEPLFPVGLRPPFSSTQTLLNRFLHDAWYKNSGQVRSDPRWTFTPISAISSRKANCSARVNRGLPKSPAFPLTGRPSTKSSVDTLLVATSSTYRPHLPAASSAAEPRSLGRATANRYRSSSKLTSGPLKKSSWAVERIGLWSTRNSPPKRLVEGLRCSSAN
jgi:hypothetical protein